MCGRFVSGVYLALHFIGWNCFSIDCWFLRSSQAKIRVHRFGRWLIRVLITVLSFSAVLVLVRKLARREKEKLAFPTLALSGKTNCVLRFVNGQFRDTYIPTIEDTYRQVVSCNKQITTLQITDTYVCRRVINIDLTCSALLLVLAHTSSRRCNAWAFKRVTPLCYSIR